MLCWCGADSTLQGHRGTVRLLFRTVRPHAVPSLRIVACLEILEVATHQQQLGFRSWAPALKATMMRCATEPCCPCKDFLVPIGRLIMTGPAVLPLAGQRYRCVRMRQCEIENFQGLPMGSTSPNVVTTRVATAAVGFMA